MSDVELPMWFESAHSVPKLCKFWHFVTSSLIAYIGPRGPSQATPLSKYENFVSDTKSFFAVGRAYTNEIPHVKSGWSVIWRAQLRPSGKKVMQAHLRGRF